MVSAKPRSWDKVQRCPHVHRGAHFDSRSRDRPTKFEPLAEADTEYSDVGQPDYAAETEAEAEADGAG